MTEDPTGDVGRRRMVKTLAASGLASTLAGCSGSDGDGRSSDSDGGADGGDGTDSTSSETSSSADSESADDGTATTAGDGDDAGGLSKDDDDSGTSDDAGTVSDVSGAVPATVRLTIPSVKANVDEFERLRATFERFELEAADGSTVTLDATTQEVDLVDVGEGGTVELFETEISAGAYENGTLYMPVEAATLADGSDPEFDDVVPTSRSVRGDAIEVGGDDAIGFDVRLGLVRVGGDGPWTYNLSWGVGPA